MTIRLLQYLKKILLSSLGEEDFFKRGIKFAMFKLFLTISLRKSKWQRHLNKL